MKEVFAKIKEMWPVILTLVALIAWSVRVEVKATNNIDMEAAREVFVTKSSNTILFEENTRAHKLMQESQDRTEEKLDDLMLLMIELKTQ
jgi:hypothetical protein